MSNRTGRVILAPLAALAGAAASFVLITVSMDTISDAALVGVACAVAFVLVLAFQGVSGFSALRKTSRADLGLAALGGALAFWAAPLIALSQRASDAPSGADTLFFTTTVWGLLCVAAAFALRSERPAVTALAGAFGAVAGAAGLLASWENPSSFSPFAKFPLREALMLLAGLAFAVGAVALASAAKRTGARIAAVAGLAAATAVGLSAALFALPSLGEVSEGALFPCIYLGMAFAVFALGWTTSTAEVGVSRSSIALLGVPVAVMALAGVERLTNVYGPNPIEWPGALAGAAVIVACMIVVWMAAPSAPAQPAHVHRALKLPLGLAVAAAALALVSLATPALNAVAEGGTGEPFRAAWTMVGAESATGWLAVAAAGLALASVMVARLGEPRRSWLPAVIATVVCAVAAIPLIGATLHTWNRWVPAEVQQTYGTEYSRLLIEPRLEPIRLAAIVLAVVSVGVLAFSARRDVIGNDILKEDVR